MGKWPDMLLGPKESKEGGAEGGLLDEGCCSAAITACGKGGQWDHVPLASRGAQ